MCAFANGCHKLRLFTVTSTSMVPCTFAQRHGFAALLERLVMLPRGGVEVRERVEKPRYLLRGFV